MRATLISATTTPLEAELLRDVLEADEFAAQAVSKCQDMQSHIDNMERVLRRIRELCRAERAGQREVFQIEALAHYVLQGNKYV